MPFTSWQDVRIDGQKKLPTSIAGSCNEAWQTEKRDGVDWTKLIPSALTSISDTAQAFHGFHTHYAFRTHYEILCAYWKFSDANIRKVSWKISFLLLYYEGKSLEWLCWCSPPQDLCEKLRDIMGNIQNNTTNQVLMYRIPLHGCHNLRLRYNTTMTLLHCTLMWKKLYFDVKFIREASSNKTNP